MLGRDGIAERAEAWREVLAAAAVALVGGLFLWELLGLQWVPVARDMQMFFVPQRYLVWEALREGRIPLWTPFYGTGAPLLANFQSGVFYPPHWLYALLPFHAAFDLLVVGHFVLGGVSAYAFSRACGMTRAAAGVAGTVFMLGGHFASLLNLANALQAAAWVPAVGYFAVRHLGAPTTRSFLGLVGTAALGFLAGEPQTFVLGTGACGAFALVLTAQTRGSEVRWRRAFGLLGLALLVTAGLTMVQVLPTAELLANSSRAGGLRYEEATAFALPPTRLVHLVFPPDFSDPVFAFGVKTQIGADDPWLFSVYLGVVPLLLAYASFADRRRRWEAIFWTAAAALGILLSLGDHSPVYGWLFRHVPGVSAFRYPEKFFLLAGLGVAVLAGYGFDSLRRRAVRPSFLAVTAVALVGAIVAKAFWLFGKQAFHSFAEAYIVGNFLANYDFAWRVWGGKLDLLLVELASAVALAWLHLSRRLSPTLLLGLLGLLAGVDLFLAHRGLNPVVEKEFYTREPLIGRHLPLTEVRRDFRYRSTPPFGPMAGIVRAEVGAGIESQKWLWQQMMFPNTNQLHGVLAPDTWDAIHLRRYADRRQLQRILPDEARRWRLQELTSVKYVYAREPLGSGPYEAVAKLDSFPGLLYTLADPVPRAYVVPGARFYEDEVAALNGALAADFDPHREVALVGRSTSADSIGPAGDAAGPLPTEPATARIVEDGGEIVRIAFSAPAGGWLVLTDSFYPGWTAFVDGEEREVRIANYFYRAVRVGPDDREVVFRYRSRPYEAGRWISAGTLGLLLLGVGVVRLRGRVPRPRGSRTPSLKGGPR